MPPSRLGKCYSLIFFVSAPVSDSTDTEHKHCTQDILDGVLGVTPVPVDYAPTGDPARQKLLDVELHEDGERSTFVTFPVADVLQHLFSLLVYTRVQRGRLPSTDVLRFSWEILEVCSGPFSFAPMLLLLAPSQKNPSAAHSFERGWTTTTPC